VEKKLTDRFERIEMDCSKCPIPKPDCEWMQQTFEWRNKPLGVASKWCPLLVAVANVMSFLLRD